MRRVSLLLACWSLLAFPGFATAERYEAFLRDGARIAGEKLTDIHEALDAKLDKLRLFDGDRSTRLVRDTQQQIAPARNAGGTDQRRRAAGRIAGWTADSGGSSRPARFLVAVGGAAGGDLWAGTIAVRATACGASPPPNLVPRPASRV